MELIQRREGEPVAEAGVDGVLEVRVRVDEAGDDHRARVMRPGAELVDGADRGDAPVLDRDGAPLDRRALDGKHPVGERMTPAHDPAESNSDFGVHALPAGSVTTHSQIGASYEDDQRDRLDRRRDRVDRREGAPPITATMK